MRSAKLGGASMMTFHSMRVKLTLDPCCCLRASVDCTQSLIAVESPVAIALSKPLSKSPKGPKDGRSVKSCCVKISLAFGPSKLSPDDKSVISSKQVATVFASSEIS